MAIDAKYPGLLGINELQNNIMQLESQFESIKHKTQQEIRTHTKFFNDWYNFYNQFIGQAELIPEDTMFSLNQKYHQTAEIIDKIARRSAETEKKRRTRQTTPQISREEQLRRQAQIDEEERLKRQQLAEDILREDQPEGADPITHAPIEPIVGGDPITYGPTEQAEPVDIPTHGTGNWQQLSKSWDTLIDQWTRIEVLPERNIVQTVERSIERWLNFYDGTVSGLIYLGKPIPPEVQSQLGKYSDLYERTKRVVESALGQSRLLATAPTAAPLDPSKIKLAPGQVIDPRTGMVMAAEHLVTAPVPGIAPAPIPASILPGGPRMPQPIVQPSPEPIYTPPPTIIIKQTIPPYDPPEPSIPADEPLIFEPVVPRISDIGGGLIEPTVVPEVEEILETAQANWPWFAGLGLLLFLARAR